MKIKKEKCKYCGGELESKTTRKEFCSSKCRVYFHREENAGPVETFKSVAHEKSITKELIPPAGLKGIDLAIWKAENQSKG